MSGRLGQVTLPPIPPVGFDPGSRRLLVLQLRLAGQTQQATATTLRVSQPTVSRDLAWWRCHPPSMGEAFDRGVFIGESLALLGEVRRLAYEEHARLSADKAASGALGAEARLGCLRAIVAAQQLADRMLGR